MEHGQERQERRQKGRRPKRYELWRVDGSEQADFIGEFHQVGEAKHRARIQHLAFGPADYYILDNDGGRRIEDGSTVTTDGGAEVNWVKTWPPDRDEPTGPGEAVAAIVPAKVLRRMRPPMAA